MLQWLTKKIRLRRTAQQLYGSIVARARHSDFYTRFAVEDSVEGRFELITLHHFLLLNALKAHGGDAEDVSEILVDVLFEDLDGNIREMGVGDLSVPKKMRTFADAYYGRATTYRAALQSNDGFTLSAALSRNVYGADFDALDNERKAMCKELCDYVRCSAENLATRSLEELMSEGVAGLGFPGAR